MWPLKIYNGVLLLSEWEKPSEYKGLRSLFVVAFIVCRDFVFDPFLMSRDMRFPTM